MSLRICVYCSASERIDPKYREVARHLGELIAQKGHDLVYGGGRLGLMGVVASSVVEHGGHVIGFITDFLDEREGAHPGIDELHVVESMHTRKMKMSEKGDAFVILPGGFGTLDEFFEIFVWKQLNIHSKPIIILNSLGYWDPLVHLMDAVITQKFAHEEHRDFFKVAQTPEEVISLLV